MKTRKHINKPVMRAATRFQPWDFGYMLDIESKCLIEMAKYFETSDIAQGNPRRAMESRLMAKLLAIANDEEVDYYEAPRFETIKEGKVYLLKTHGEGKMNKHVNLNNAHRFMRDFHDSPLMLNTLRREKAWHLYHAMRVQYLRSCWD